MKWTVRFSKKAHKGLKKAPAHIQDAAYALLRDLEANGPAPGARWKNYSQLAQKGHHHCHLAYHWSACWVVIDAEIRFMEVYYVGSRENAPY
jgi:hypothetical protein